MDDKCALHAIHQPMPMKLERHVIIPVEWQEFWRPPPDRGQQFPDDFLWDSRSILVCPTGHRNIHTLIGRMLRAKGGERITLERTPLTSMRVARQGIRRYEAFGGNVQTLIKMEMWGEGS